MHRSTPVAGQQYMRHRRAVQWLQSDGVTLCKSHFALVPSTPPLAHPTPKQGIQALFLRHVCVPAVLSFHLAPQCLHPISTPPADATQMEREVMSIECMVDACVLVKAVPPRRSQMEEMGEWVEKREGWPV